MAQTYSYDKLNRVLSAEEPSITGGQGWKRSYNYDRWGNQWVDATNSSGINVYSVTPTGSAWITPKNRINLSAGSYDRAGNQISLPPYSAAYDADNRLTTMSGTLAYAYDGEGRRVKKANGSLTTRYVYDAFGKLAAEYAVGTAPSGAPQAECSTCYLTVDHLGSTRVLWDSAGVKGRYDYMPFGDAIPSDRNKRDSVSCAAEVTGCYAGSGSLTMRFTGKERDAETSNSAMGDGLDYFGARYMSSAQGRFTSPDPLLNSGRPDDPQSWNRYAYVSNNPLRYGDPFGLYKWASNCDEANDSACKADRDRFRAAYADLKKAAGNLEEGSKEKKQLDKIIKRIGEEDKGKVKIAFGDAGHDPNGNPNAGSTLGNTITLNWNAVSSLATSYGASLGYDQYQTSTLFNNMAAGLVGHEGGHLAGSGIPGLSLMMRTERTGLYSESATDQGLHYTDLIYKLWNESWTKLDVQTREEFRTQGIQTELNRQSGKEPPK